MKQMQVEARRAKMFDYCMCIYPIVNSAYPKNLLVLNLNSNDDDDDDDACVFMLG